MALLDPHSYADNTHPSVSSFDWKATVDFEAKVLHAAVCLRLERPSRKGVLDLDTRDLDIQAVTTGDQKALKFELAPPEPILGSRLRVQLPEGITELCIRYRTSPEASALQWLEPEQTLGQKQ